MKKIIYILSISLLMFGSSCQDSFTSNYLDVAPEDDLNLEKVFGDYSLFTQFADQTYSYVPGHYSQLFNAMQAGMSDECRNLKGEACTALFNEGTWDGTEILQSSDKDKFNINREISYVWRDSYIGIRKCNAIMENIDRVPNFPNQQVKERYLGEAYYLRAMFYFQLTKRWGGVPLILKVLNYETDDTDLPRSTYEDCVAQMVSDCDKAASLLPLKHQDVDNGHATKGAALALKSRALLYAARPLHNPEGDPAKWEAARNAAMDVIAMNQYSLYASYKDLFFQPICDEIILNRPRPKMNFNTGNIDKSHFWVRFIATNGYDTSWMGASPTQNFVDLFEDSKGYPITHSSTIYNSQNPYKNRDPRLPMIVIHDGLNWNGRWTDFSTYIKADGSIEKLGADRGGASQHKTDYGYAIGKLWPTGFRRYNGTSTYLNYIYFRYAEILLNFAEAQNEVGGPESSYSNGGTLLSVREALSQVRIRAGHVAVPADISNTTDLMRERIRNERAIELSFEDHRWYDLLTWKKGVEYLNKDIYGMNIFKKLDNSKTYSIEKVSTAVFKEHMYLYPIPYNEIYKSAGILKQNPGWE